MPNAIRIGMPLLPDANLDPSDMSSIWKFYLMDQMTEQLLYAHRDDYYSAISERWEVSRNQKRYVFYLDKKAKFSDGSSITSNEVALSFKRLILRTGLHWKVSNYLLEADKLKSINDTIKGIEVINPHTIALNLKEPYITIMYMLSMAESGILSPKQIDMKDLFVKSWEVTSGAYTGKYENDKWRLQLNPHRLRLKKSNPMPKIAEFVDVDCIRSAGESLISGKLDIFIPGSDYSASTRGLLASKKIQHTLGTYTSTEYLYLNISKPPFNDLALRRSIYKNWYQRKLQLPADNHKLVSKANQLFLPTSPGYLDILDIEAISNSFKSTSLSKKVKVRFLIPPFYKESPFYLHVIKSVLEEHNIEVEIIKVPREEGLKIIKENQFDLFFMYTSMSPSEMNTVLSFMFSKNVPLHDIDNEIVPLIQKASHSTDISEEAKLNKEIAKKLILNAEIIPTLYLKMPYFYRKGLDLSAIDKYDNDFHLWEVQQITRKQTLKR